MTREKQIIEKAGKESEIFYKVNDNYGDCFHGGFIDGAKWADANPQFSKEEFIEKACDWLNKYASDYAFSVYDEDDACSVSMDLVDDFKEAMGQLWNEEEKNELIDALYNMIVKLKEEGMI